MLVRQPHITWRTDEFSAHPLRTRWQVTDAEVDMFDREAVFIQRKLVSLGGPEAPCTRWPGINQRGREAPAP